jgi:hypothetical protein
MGVLSQPSLQAPADSCNLPGVISAPGRIIEFREAFCGIQGWAQAVKAGPRIKPLTKSGDASINSVMTELDEIQSGELIP